MTDTPRTDAVVTHTPPNSELEQLARDLERELAAAIAQHVATNDELRDEIDRLYREEIPRLREPVQYAVYIEGLLGEMLNYATLQPVDGVIYGRSHRELMVAVRDALRDRTPVGVALDKEPLIDEALTLLKQAQCPVRGCDGGTIYAANGNDPDGREVGPCSWCAEVAELERTNADRKELDGIERTAEGFIVKKPQPGSLLRAAGEPLTPGCYCQPGKCGAPKPQWCRDAAKRDWRPIHALQGGEK